jgi:hypothetical protein
MIMEEDMQKVNQNGAINLTPESNIERAMGRGWIPIE